MTREAIPIVAALLSVMPVGAQPPDEALRQAVFHGVTEVNLVNVEVTVTDRRGEPVTGLSRDDFLVRENGRPVEITNFYAVEDGSVQLETVAEPLAEAQAEIDPALQAGPTPRHLLIYVDNANLRESNRARAFSQLRDFLLESLPPETRVMVVTNDAGNLRLRQPSTPALHDVFYALDRIQREATVRPRFDIEERDILRAMAAVNVELGAGGGESGFLAIKDGVDSPDKVALEARNILPRIERHSVERQQHTVASLQVLGQLIDLVAGLPGRKALLYVSDGLELRPGEALLEAYSRRFAQVGSVAAEVRPELMVARYDSSPILDALLARANSGGITFYSVDAAPLDSFARGSAAESASSGGLFASWDDSYASTRTDERQAALRRLADQTGGRTGLTPAALETLFQGVADDFTNRYSLGYVAEPTRDDAEREIEVELRDPGRGYTLRYRRSFRDLGPIERAAQRTRTALLVDDVGNPLHIVIETTPSVPHQDGGFVVPLLVHVPLGKLVLIPGPEAHQGRVDLFVAVRDDLGRTSQVDRHLCPIRIPNEELLTALGQTAACGVRLRMRGGAQRIGVTVLDEIANTSSTSHLELDPSASSKEGDGAP